MADITKESAALHSASLLLSAGFDTLNRVANALSESDYQLYGKVVDPELRDRIEPLRDEAADLAIAVLKFQARVVAAWRKAVNYGE